MHVCLVSVRGYFPASLRMVHLCILCPIISAVGGTEEGEERER